VYSSVVGYDGGQAVRDEEFSVWQRQPEREQKEETKQSRWASVGRWSETGWHCSWFRSCWVYTLLGLPLGSMSSRTRVRTDSRPSATNKHRRSTLYHPVPHRDQESAERHLKNQVRNSGRCPLRCGDSTHARFLLYARFCKLIHVTSCYTSRMHLALASHGLTPARY
jgi:hypothetical protein